MCVVVQREHVDGRPRRASDQVRDTDEWCSMVPLIRPNSPTSPVDDLRALSQSPLALVGLGRQRMTAASRTNHTCANTWARAAILHSRAALGSLLNQNPNMCRSSLQPTSDTDHHQQQKLPRRPTPRIQP